MRAWLHSLKHSQLSAPVRWDRSASEGAGVALGSPWAVEAGLTYETGLTPTG